MKLLSKVIERYPKILTWVHETDTERSLFYGSDSSIRGTKYSKSVESSEVTVHDLLHQAHFFPGVQVRNWNYAALNIYGVHGLIEEHHAVESQKKSDITL